MHGIDKVCVVSISAYVKFNMKYRQTIKFKMLTGVYCRQLNAIVIALLLPRTFVF